MSAHAELLTVEQVANEFTVSVGAVNRWAAHGLIRVNKGNLFSRQAVAAFIRRQQRVTRRYLKLRAGGMNGRKAWAVAFKSVYGFAPQARSGRGRR